MSHMVQTLEGVEGGLGSSMSVVQAWPVQNPQVPQTQPSAQQGLVQTMLQLTTACPAS